MAPPLLALKDARLTFGGRPTFEGVSLALGRGDRACLVGRNGSGKSTLLRVLAGLIDLDAGERFQQPGSRVAYMPQEPLFDPTLTAAEFVAQGLSHDPHDGDRSHLIEAVLDEAEVAPDRLLANLSGGEGRRISLAAALVAEPDILLLDEPTNHLDIPAIEWLEERMLGFAGGILMVSHDRAFLNRLSRQMLWLDRGTMRRLDKGFPAFDEWSAAVLADEDAERRRIDKRIATEMVWLREGISGRRRRNEGRVTRLMQMRQERAQRVSLGTAKIGPASAESGGRIVIEAVDIDKSYATPSGSKTIARKFSTRILRGDRVGVIGRNGSGKTTLLGVLTGAIPPDAGTVRQGTNLMPAIFDQTRASLDPEATPWTTLAGESGDTVTVQGRPRHVASYLKDFLFEDRQFRAKISGLSGGERNRLLLAKILAQPSNLLILDEPTNDLDMETLDLLEEILADYDGTLLLVSHDRDFLDRLVTSVIAVEGDGVIDEYAGGYSDYLRQRRPAATRRTPSPVAAKPAARPRDASPGRLGFKEQRELDLLPKRIAELELEKKALAARLADPELYARSRTEFAAATSRHEQLDAELAEAEERWLALAEKAEALARGKV
ncbi:MAG: hfaC [Rhodospirillales bacterium]|nr:hfaC [Rhodospirillales bacterium]